jgi:hypothetical protein
MGQGSRGGNSGISSSGSRQRDDKDMKKAAQAPKKVPSDKDDKKKDSGGNGLNGIPGRGIGRGLRGIGRLARDLDKLKPKSSSSSKPYTKSAGSKSVSTSSVQNPRANRLQPIKPAGVKLTTQKTNKTPN